jgi:hypothetical protein
LRSLYCKKEKLLQSLNNKSLLPVNMQEKIEEQLKQIEQDTLNIKTRPSKQICNDNDEVEFDTPDENRQMIHDAGTMTLQQSHHYHGSSHYAPYPQPTYSSYHYHPHAHHYPPPQQPPFNQHQDMLPYYSHYQQPTPYYSNSLNHQTCQYNTDIPIIRDMQGGYVAPTVRNDDMESSSDNCELPSFNSLVQSLGRPD